MISGVRIMGILNVTPDSFSDGGLWNDRDRAVQHALDQIRDGADIIDVGGESTRPGATRVSPEVEQVRVIPVIRDLAEHEAETNSGVEISIDTVNADTARCAVAAGASIVNDVSGGLADPDMFAAVAETGSAVVLMHWRDFLVPGEKPHYGDVVAEVSDHLMMRVDAARAAGIPDNHIIIDPGLGFSKNAEHNWALLRALDRFTASGYPVLVGASRKRFIAELTGATGTDPESLAVRDAMTAAISVLTANAGGWGVRVHDVAATAAALGLWRRATAMEATHA